MKQYVLLYRNANELPAADLALIRAMAGVTILRISRSPVMLVEGPESLVGQVNRLPGWTASEQRSYSLC